MYHMADVLWQFVKTQIGSNYFFSGAVLGGFLVACWHYLRGIPKKIWDYVWNRVTVSFMMEMTDEAYPFMQQLVLGSKYDGWQKKYRIFSRKLESDFNEQGLVPLRLFRAPMSGTYFFKYAGKLMWMHCERSTPTADQSSSQKSSWLVYETITVKYFGRSLLPLETLIKDLQRLHTREHHEEAGLYIKSEWSADWERFGALPNRPMNSVILDDSVLENLLADLKDFSTKESWYVEHGLPYHRGYLFHGLPGTGKTSSVVALAKELGKNVYCVNTPTLSESGMITLFQKVERNSILVIEDVDSFFEGREKRKDVQISFSTFINLIDGVATKHGLILILTTNHKEKLDAALIRPGRMDVCVEFKNCTKEQLERMFLRFFKGSPRAAKEFAATVAADSYSPARIQTYLITKKTAEEALANLKDLERDE